MHPPSFSSHQRLADWPQCVLDLHCKRCGGRTVHLPIRMLLERYGHLTFRSFVPKLRCKGCGIRPAPVHLIAGFHRTNCRGPEPCWAVELVHGEEEPK